MFGVLRGFCFSNLSPWSGRIFPRPGRSNDFCLPCPSLGCPSTLRSHRAPLFSLIAPNHAGFPSDRLGCQPHNGTSTGVLQPLTPCGLKCAKSAKSKHGGREPGRAARCFELSSRLVENEEVCRQRRLMPVEPSLRGFPARCQRGDVIPKIPAMCSMPQVCQFVRHYIFQHLPRCKN